MEVMECDTALEREIAMARGAALERDAAQQRDAMDDSRGRRYYDPVLCLLLWAVALEGEPARECLQALGVGEVEMEAMFSGYEPELAEMRRLRMVSELFGRQRLGELMRARLAEMLMACRKGTELGALARAAERMPPWVFGEQPESAPAAPLAAHHGIAGFAGTAAAGMGPSASEIEQLLGPEFVDENGQLDLEMALGEVRKLMAEYDRLGDAQQAMESYSAQER